MTDKEVEDIIKSNMNLQINLAGIRADFEEKLQRTFVGLTKKEFQEAVEGLEDLEDCWVAIESALRSKNYD
jgi:dynactin complex subunit